MKALLTPKQVVERLQLSPSTVLRWLQTGQLKGFKAGKSWRLTEEDLQSFFQPNKPRAEE